MLPGGNTRSTLHVGAAPPYAVRGLGCRLLDDAGRWVLDGNNNYTALIHGHARPEVVRSACDAVGAGACFGLPTVSEITLAEHLSSRMAGPTQWRFTNSGSEAVMLAIRVCRAVTGRRTVVRFRGSYHGTYDLVSDSALPGGDEHAVVLPWGDEPAYRAAMDRLGAAVACVLVDLMPNRLGMPALSRAFVETLRQTTAATGALLAFDEVITFRLAYGGLQETYGVTPDVTTLGKLIGGGHPIGAVGGAPAVMGVCDPGSGRSPVSWGGTFNANPVSMRAGVTALSLYHRDAVTRLNRLGDGLRERLRAAGVEATGSGSLVHLSGVFDQSLWWRLYDAGVLACSNGLLALSTAFTEGDVEELAEAVLRSV